MNLQAEKIELVKLLLDTDDQSLLKDIRSLFARKKANAHIPQYVIDGIKQSQEQLRNGLFISYDEVKKELDKI